MKIKEAYDRFRQWQQEPLHYANKSHGSVRCNNCGTEFEANFCPICGQKAGTGRVTWQTVRQGVTLIWGMDNRSLSYTLLQLVLRPGYLIRDYISGRRQVAFPPMKMLLLVAMVGVMISALTGDTASVESTADEEFHFINVYGEWFEKNPGWGMLGLFSMLLLPTWHTFHFAPRYPRHTLPEGFFILVFMTTLMILVIYLSELISDWMLLLVFVYYIVAYRQLFGYGWWGTTWRFFVILIEGVCLMTFIVSTIEFVVIGNLNIFSNDYPKDVMIRQTVIWSVAFAAMISGVHYLNKRGYKRLQ